MQVILCFWIDIIHIHENPVIDAKPYLCKYVLQCFDCKLLFYWSENLLKTFR